MNQHRQTLRGEGLVEFDHVHLRQRQAGQFEHLARGGCRAHAHDARRHTGRRHADDARARREAVLLRRFFVGNQQRAGAVVDARGVAGRSFGASPATIAAATISVR